MMDIQGMRLTSAMTRVAGFSPPVDACRSFQALNDYECVEVIPTMISWAPEAFEKGLERIFALRS